MDLKDFTNDAPGKTVRIILPEGPDWAFVPDPLTAVNWQFPVRLWPLLGEVKLQLGVLEGIGRNLPNPGILLRPMENREALKSSELEGTYATAKELLLFDLYAEEASEPERRNDFREITNYRRGLSHAQQSPLPISLRLIRELHQILMTGVRGKDKTPGEFRKGQVAIGTNHRFIPPPPDYLDTCLNEMEQSIHQTADGIDALVKCFLIHYQFETIHPFSDGNGRVGRMLLSLMLQRACNLTKPWVYLSEFFEKRKPEYISKLYETSTQNRWDEWVEFCLVGTLEQVTKTLRGCERLREIRESMFQNVTEKGGSTRLYQIIERLFHSPFVTIPDIQKLNQTTYPTAKSDLQKLVDLNLLQELPNTQVKTFYAPGIFSVAYEGFADTNP